MGQYRKKPVVIEAYQYQGGSVLSDAPDWLNIAVAKKNILLPPEGGDKLMVMTIEGPLRANKGDYIIRGVEGEIYPIKHDIFTKTYDPA